MTKVVEGEFTEVVQAEEVQAAPAIKCAVTVGMTEAGDIFFNAEGSDQSLINMEGLLKYADRHMERVWNERLEVAKQAQ